MRVASAHKGGFPFVRTTGERGPRNGREREELRFMPMTIATSANPISMSQAITDLIESIALEETALSHILHAESEKLHKAINMGEVTLEEIMNVNDTVMSMVSTCLLYTSRCV